jgi:hypothetical protein
MNVVYIMNSVLVVRTFQIVRKELVLQSVYIIYFLGFSNWSLYTLNVADLKDNMVPHLVQLGAICESNQGSYNINECQLILNRLARYVDIEKPYMKICMYHLTFFHQT